MELACQFVGSWPGAVGTAVLSLAYDVEHRLRPQVQGPLDYEDGLVPGQIMAGIMRLPSVTDREEHELGLGLRCSYGSVFGLFDGLLRRRIREPWAGAAFGTTLMTATLTLFPLLGRTPPPWRWPPSVITTAFATHAAYVVAVAAVDGGNSATARTRSRRVHWVSLIKSGCRASAGVHAHACRYFARRHGPSRPGAA